jgi:hypothetical protein
LLVPKTKTSVNGPVKTTITLPEDAVAVLHELARARNVSFAECVRRALKMEKFFNDVRKQGGRVLIEDADHVIKEIVIF